MLLRRNNVALDIVCFGYTNDVEKLQELQRTVNSSDNSHLITIPPGSGILSDALMNTPIVQGEDAPAGGQA
jgi:26S proteasome regulatory subunit N10